MSDTTFYSNLKKYIKIFPNLFSESFCDDLVAEFKEDDLWQLATTIDSNAETATLSSHRSCDELFLSDPYVISRNQEVRQSIDNTIYSGLSASIHNYLEHFHKSSIVRDTGYNLLRYKPGNFYKEHFDTQTNPVQRKDGTIEKWSLYPRQVSVVIQLNTDFEGGV